MKKNISVLIVFALVLMAFFSACGDDGCDSVENASTDEQEKSYEFLKTAQVGDLISFGKYEQDNNSSNGKEDVEWLVLKKEGKQILVISKYVLDGQEFYSKEVSYENGMPSVTWDISTIRQWLNEDFLKVAFSSDEQGMIPTVTVSAEYYRKRDPNPGEATRDKLFFLSRSEVEEYLDSNLKRQCEATTYAISRGVELNDDSGKSDWPLRSPGYHELALAGVNGSGEFDNFVAGMVDDVVPVRPAMWITIDF